jgi:hypothetical protein
MASDRRAQLVERRRRRVLREERGETVSDAPAGLPQQAKQHALRQAYTDAARADRQPRITDLIPQKPATLLIILLAGLTTICGIQVLFLHRPLWTRWIATADLASLDLTAQGSLASWFSSSVLLCAAVYALLVFNIRRHKLDDYRGRYGLWRWAVLGCLVASIDCTAGLHQILQGALMAAAGTPLVGDGSVWWIGCGTCLFGVVATRAFLDMRSCPGASVCFGLAVNCYLLATMIQLGFVHWVDGVVTAMLHSSVLLTGHLLLLFSFLVYARYVFLEAQGQIASAQAVEQPRAARPWRLFSRGRPVTAAGEAEQRANRNNTNRSRPTAPSQPTATHGAKRQAPEQEPLSAEASPQPSGNGPAPTSSSRQTSDTEKQPAFRVRTPDADDSDQAGQTADASSLSKAERRRLRKLQRRQNRAA